MHAHRFEESGAADADLLDEEPGLFDRCGQIPAQGNPGLSLAPAAPQQPGAKAERGMRLHVDLPLRQHPVLRLGEGLGQGAGELLVGGEGRLHGSAQKVRTVEQADGDQLVVAPPEAQVRRRGLGPAQVVPAEIAGVEMEGSLLAVPGAQRPDHLLEVVRGRDGECDRHGWISSSSRLRVQGFAAARGRPGRCSVRGAPSTADTTIVMRTNRGAAVCAAPTGKERR